MRFIFWWIHNRPASEMLTSAPENYIFLNKALGSEHSKLVLQERGAMSTFLQRTALTEKITESTYEVDVITLDSLVYEMARNKRCGLKIDTEGFEVEVMRGLDKYEDHFDFVVAEVSVLNRFEDSYNFSELITIFYEKGFRFYNFLNEPKPQATRFYDCLFLQENDPRFDKDI
jgi:FkbM family methyltransferase